MAIRQGLTLESRFSGLIASCGHRALVSSWSGHVGQAASGHREKVWREFFSEPSQWWDCWPEKVNARYPDFKHKKTQDALWIGDRRNPPWVAAEVAAMAPGTVQMDSFSVNTRLAKYVKTGEYEKTMELFKQMQKRCMRPDRFTFVPVLNACAGLRAIMLPHFAYMSTRLVPTKASKSHSKMLGECSARCHLKMWSLGQP
jgi:pentatricopeptide repeat protein